MRGCRLILLSCGGTPLVPGPSELLGLFCALASPSASCFTGKRVVSDIVAIFVAQEGKLFRRCARVMSSCHFPDYLEAGLSSASSMLLVCDPCCSAGRLVV